MTREAPHEHATQLRNHWWWRPGWREGHEFYTWHLTFEGQTDLHRLVTTYQDALRDVPGLDLIPLRWLHLTMQGVGFTDEVTDHDVHAIANTATQRISKLAPIELTFHQLVVRSEALALPPVQTDHLVMIRNSIRDAIATVWGNDAVPETANRFDPHVSLAYVNTDAPAIGAINAITSIEPRSALVAVRRASLIILRRDNHLYRWELFASAPFSNINPKEPGQLC